MRRRLRHALATPEAARLRTLASVSTYACAPNDRFGVPGNVLTLPDDFYGALGCVAAVGALVELNVSHIVVMWGNDQADAGRLMSHLSKRFKTIKRVLGNHQEYCFARK